MSSDGLAIVQQVKLTVETLFEIRLTLECLWVDCSVNLIGWQLAMWGSWSWAVHASVHTA